MNYELFMGEALAEARLALERGERPIAAVAVVDEAMVVRAHDRVQEANDPTAHAFAVANSRDGAAGTIIQLAQHPSLPRRIKVVSGIRRDEAEALFAPLAAG